jgi:hypothetical protein
MDRAEFIKQIMDLYPRTFNRENVVQYQGWINRYKNAIPENWDFERLMWYFDTEWHSTIEPPHPSFFRKYRDDVKPIVMTQEPSLTPEEREKAHESFIEFQKKLKTLTNNKTIN